MMVIGAVNWFNPAKGHRSIEPKDGLKDTFVHISAVERAGLSSLTDGQKYLTNPRLFRMANNLLKICPS